MSTTKKQSRQIGALTRLKAQLESGVKPAHHVVNGKKITLSDVTELLNDSDKSRIKKEINVLESRIPKTLIK